MERTILHCDCNSFFASVETALNPSYRNVPMAVCGSQEDRHGIVLAKNDEAKKYGIKTAETVYSAKKKCPSLVIATPHYDASPLSIISPIQKSRQKERSRRQTSYTSQAAFPTE